MRTLAALLVCTCALFAQSVDQSRPDCGAVDDPVLIGGSGFAEEPVVDFNGTAAEVIKSNGQKILVRVPEGATTGPITVDGQASAVDFTVLADGAPVVIHLSAKKATVGQRIVLIGRRLDEGTAEFVDGAKTTAASVELTGRRRAATFKVPEGLAAGSYTLRITNGDGLDTGDCSPEIEIVEAGAATLDSITPEGALAGEKIELNGTDLGPIGPARVTWTDSGGDKLETFGFSNGFGRIVSHVPFKAEAGTAYDVTAKPRDATKSNALSYTVGRPEAPSVTELDPAAGPAGSTFRILGENLFVFGGLPRVEMAKGGTTIEAKVLFGFPGFGKFDARLIARVPNDAEDGAYDVTVTVGGRTSNAAAFEVGDQPLAVDSMTPTSQGPKGTFKPVVISGSGFGTFGSGKLTVTWDDGVSEARKGFLVFRTDSKLRVIPPGGRFKPLKAGTYDVYVNRGEDSVLAGTYTVE